LFLCPRCRAGPCNGRVLGTGLADLQSLCPRCRAGLCNLSDHFQRGGENWGFYALGVGLGFAISCPPRRTTPTSGGFYALGVGLGFAITINVKRLSRREVGVKVSMPSVSGWALQFLGGVALLVALGVSMPSVSGWALQPLVIDY